MTTIGEFIDDVRTLSFQRKKAILLLVEDMKLVCMLKSNSKEKL